MLPRFGLAVFASCLPLAGFAATIESQLSGNVTMAGLFAPPEMFANLSKTFGPTETLSASDSESISASGGFGSGVASAQYAVEATTGQLRFGLNANVVPTPDGGAGSAASSALLSLTEAYRVVGSGTVTVAMEVSAEWASPQFFLSGCVTYNASPYGTTGVAFNSNCLLRESAIDGMMGLVAGEIVAVSFDVPEGTDGLVDFTWFLHGGVAVGGGLGPARTGFLDVMNTANIFVRTEGDVTATPQTAGFLSNPAFGGDPDVSAVPLPASAVLLLGGLAGLGLVRRRRGT